MKHDVLNTPMCERLPENDPALECVLFSAAEIQARIEELAEKIVRDHAGMPALRLVGVLKGAVVFLVDLGRAIRRLGGPPVRYDFIRASTYGETIKTATGIHRETRIEALPKDLRDQDVILVEDMLDQGLTIARIRETLCRTAGVRSVKLCVLLDKQLSRPTPRAAAFRAAIQPDYIGFEVPDRWVVGYGLDADEMYRDLPYIAIASESYFSDGDTEHE